MTNSDNQTTPALPSGRAPTIMVEEQEQWTNGELQNHGDRHENPANRRREPGETEF